MPFAITIFIVGLAIQPMQGPKPDRIPEREGAKITSQNEESAQANQDSAKQTNSASSSSSIQNNQLAPPIKDEKTDKRNADIQIERHLEIFTGLLVLVGLLQAGIFWWQGTVFRRTLKAIEGQTGVLREATSVARTSANAAEKSADAANRNIDILITKERARLWIESADLHFQEGGHGKIAFTVVGHGSTEAFIVESYMNRYISASSEDIIDSGVRTSLPEVIIPHNPVTEMLPLEREEIWEVAQGPTAYVHLLVVVRYKDVFDGQWEMKSRYTWRITILSGGAFAWSEWKHKTEEQKYDRN